MQNAPTQNHKARLRVLLFTPPMTQLNTPYPATAYLTGFLRQQGYDTVQADPALELVLRLFSREGLTRIRAKIFQDGEKTSAPSKHGPATRVFLKSFERYTTVIEPAIRFLQGKDPTAATRIASRELLPEGPAFQALSQYESLADGSDADPLSWAFGALGVQDRAKFLASLLIDDLAAVIRESIDPRFELSRYGEKLAASAPSFDPIDEALHAAPTLVDEILDEITSELVARLAPNGDSGLIVGLTAPFPGNVYGAFRMARTIRKLRPEAKILLGGGYVNTELRELEEPRVFDDIDFITLDDGEKPLLLLLEKFERELAARDDQRDGIPAAPVSSQASADSDTYLRTFMRENGRVVFKTDKKHHDIPHRNVGAPVYDGLPLDRYLSIFEMLNPMHRIWSDGRWNKLTLAHGCYWKKCSFCDITLDYIGRYDGAPADLIVDRIEKVIAETGQSGFHFVDEAAPPAVLKAMAEKLIERGISITWWGNIRFDKVFTPELARLLARSGCIAVSGGLEVASDRLLKLMNKGVTVEQVARVTRALTDAGIMVHAYLMFGFPTQTAAETIDALERVRQLFAAGCIQSAYWHRFSATVHSPVGREPAKFGIEILSDTAAAPSTRGTRELSAEKKLPRFARNDLPFHDPSGVDHDRLGVGLKKALYNFMHGIGLEQDVRDWFSETGIKVPRPKVSADLIERAISALETQSDPTDFEPRLRERARQNAENPALR